MDIVVLGHPVNIIHRGQDITKDFNPSFDEVMNVRGISIDGHLFDLGAKEIIDYNSGAFGRTVGVKVLVCYYRPSFFLTQDFRYFDISGEQLENFQPNRFTPNFNLDIHICKHFGFSAPLMCNIIQSIDEKKT